MKTKTIKLAAVSGQTTAAIAAGARAGTVASFNWGRLLETLALLRSLASGLYPVTNRNSSAPSTPAQRLTRQYQQERLKDRLHPGGTPQAVGRYL